MGFFSRPVGILPCLVLVYLVTRGSCLHTVHGFIGDTVLLPCSYDDVQGLSQKITIFWVDKDDKVVLEIPKNGLEPYTDDPEYKGRVESFRELHKTGNFSILLKNVQQSNSGPFDCLIPSIPYQEISFLNVTAKRAKTTLTESLGGAVGAQPPTLEVLLLLCLSFLGFF